MMKKTILYGVLFSSAIFATTSCSKVTDLYDPTAEINQKPESEYFDFVTTQNTTLNLNYGNLAGNALIEVFDHNPVISEEDGCCTLDGEALYKVFLDDKGCTNQEITLPGDVTDVWLYSHNWSTPLIVKADFSNNVISYSNTTSRAAATRGSLNTLNDNLSAILLDKTRNIYSLVDWDDPYGTPIDINGLYSEGEVTAEWINSIQHFLWRGFTKKSGNRIDNTEYCAETDVVNTYISPDAKDENGKPIESAQVWVTMLAESADYQNVIGYYFYNDGETFSNSNNIEKYVIVPNNSIAGSTPFTGGGYFPVDKAPMKINTRIQLLYKDKDGKFTPNFPAGCHIGYFLIQKGFESSKTDSPGVIKWNSMFFSNAEWNSVHKDWNTNRRFSCLPLSNGGLLYGVEDSGDTDWSAEDAAFILTAIPSNAVRKPAGMPTIGPDTPIPDAVQTTYKTYAFEDIWPSGGDYDLNDVMVEHTCKVTSNVKNNTEYVKSVKDIFTFVQPANSASYIDAFAVQYAASQRGAIELPEGAIDETETGSIIICEDARKYMNKEFTVTRTFSDPFFLKKDLITDLNPFIISQYKKDESQRVEVHLPKHKTTSKADESLNNHKDDAYYIDKDGKFPFAISIPKLGFTPTTESSPINVEYTRFDKWVTSEGKQNADWYNHYTKKK